MTQEQENELENVFRSHLIKARQDGIEIATKTLCTIILEFARDTKLNPQKRLVNIVNYCSKPFDNKESE